MKNIFIRLAIGGSLPMREGGTGLRGQRSAGAL